MDNQPQPVGRPSKYDPKYCVMVVDHMNKGYSLESFGAVIDVCKDTLYQWQKDFEEFSYAVKRGYAKSLLWWETTGMKGMVGLPVKYTDKDGKTQETKGPFNASVYALQMANKHKWRTGREDITTNDEKLPDPVIIYKPIKKNEGDPVG